MDKSMIKIAFAFLMVFAISCSEDFLETENKNQLTVENFYQTQQDFWMGLNSLYPPLADGGMYGLQWQLIFNSFEDRVLFETTGLDMLSINASTGNVSNMWRALYFGMYRTNVFISMINNRENIEGMTTNMRNNYLAQARALRGAYLFFLVTIFNEPIFYDENSIPTDLIGNLTNGKPEEFWDLLKEDLLFGIQNDYLPLQYPPDDVGRVTKGGAQALLAKAMLYKHYHYYVRKGQKGSTSDLEDLRLGQNMLQEIIQIGQYELIQPKAPKTREDYINAVLCNFTWVDLPAGNNIYTSENNRESVWEIQYSDERIGAGWLPGWQWSGALNAAYFSAHPSSFRNHEAHPDLFEAFETEGAPEGFERDPRAYATLYLDGDPLDFRAGSPYINTSYRSGIHNKRIAFARGLINFPATHPSRGFGLKKYHYPVYYDKDAPKNDPVNRKMIRYSDVLLMYAEITHLLNENVTEGLAALNQVRARVDMPQVDALTKQAIIHERDVELALEGWRWHDLIRWSFDPEWGINMNQILSRQTGPSGDGSFFVKGKHEYLPIPVDEINKHEGQLKQNPGW
ncbi:MAG: RagB/SusD family nutrient uptake outer membrane protein [Mariniphaga sp.]|nr:RagB/SusD family nutrient uptake outer membrane protein [Mariniphaga sp.]